MTTCYLCALRAIVNGQSIELFDEEPDLHIRRCHTDPELTRQEWQALLSAVQRQLDRDPSWFARRPNGG